MSSRAPLDFSHRYAVASTRTRQRRGFSSCPDRDTMEPDTPTFVLSVIGTLTGTAGVVLGILNYLRDRSSAVVSLKWDLQALDSRNQSKGSPMGLVSVANNRRRPLYIKLVYLAVPKRTGRGPLVLSRSLAGQKLGEGDPEFTVLISDVTQSHLREHFAADWKEIYAVAEDNCGHQFRSKTPTTRPSWAQEPGAVSGPSACTRQ
jgi:hypothetical protein